MITEPTRTCNTRQSLLDPVLVYDNCNVLESYAIQVDRKYSDHEATIVYPIVCLLAVVWSVFLPLYRLSSCRYIVCLLAVVSSVFLSLYRLSSCRCIVCLLAVVSSVFLSLYCLSSCRLSTFILI